MKKVGVLIFVVALIVGLVVSSIFSFGRIGGRIFNFSMNLGGVRGSGNLAMEKRSVTGFKAVDVGGVFQVEIVAQKDFGVEVEADDNLLPLIRTEVDGGTLRIEADKHLSTRNPIRIRISAPDIEKLEVSGAANVTLSNLKNTKLSVEGSGASRTKISGETAKLDIDVSGGSKIDADELKSATAVIDASGASLVTVNVSDDLTSDASGASKIFYAGNPKNVSSNNSGASSISPK